MASLDPSIILAGQQPNFLATAGQAAQAAGTINNVKRQNALADLYQQQGPGILQGDQQAMNALAQFDPQAAMGIQQQRQQMGQADERLQMARAAAQRAAEAHVAQMGEADRQRELEALNRGLAALSTAQDPQSWDQIAQQMQPELVGKFGERDMLMAQALGLKGALEMAQPPKPADEYQRYVQEERAAGREPLSRIDFAQAKKGEEVIYGENGNPLVVRGPSGTAKGFTEQQSKDNVFSTRARGALEALEPVANSLVSRGQQIAESIPLGIGREMQSDEFQVAQQAGTEFLQAILRKDTGAAITEQEVDSYGRTYLPQPGDGPAVLEAKRQARYRAINALESGMGPSQMLARDSALIKAAKETGQARQDEAGQGKEIPDQPPQFLSPEDADLWEWMTPSEREAILGPYPEWGGQ